MNQDHPFDQEATDPLQRGLFKITDAPSLTVSEAAGSHLMSVVDYRSRSMTVYVRSGAIEDPVCLGRLKFTS